MTKYYTENPGKTYIAFICKAEKDLEERFKKYSEELKYARELDPEQIPRMKPADLQCYFIKKDGYEGYNFPGIMQAETSFNIEKQIGANTITVIYKIAMPMDNTTQQIASTELTAFMHKTELRELESSVEEIEPVLSKHRRKTSKAIRQFN